MYVQLGDLIRVRVKKSMYRAVVCKVETEGEWQLAGVLLQGCVQLFAEDEYEILQRSPRDRKVRRCEDT